MLGVKRRETEGRTQGKRRALKITLSLGGEESRIPGAA
jgi:hypothetical protein